jgi:hypothetical protein
MKNPELSIVFDSGIQFLDDDTFNEVVMAEVELFREDEFTSLCDELQTWDVKSLHEIRDSLYAFLMTRDGKHLKLATNLVLDHCVTPEGKTDDFKIYLMTNTIEWTISVKEFEALKTSAQFSQGEEQE